MKTIASRRPHGAYIILLVLGLTAFFWKVLPAFTSATDTLTSSFISHFHLQNTIPQSNSACTKEIGKGICCDIHLSAEPCIDECRKTFMDRQTWAVTKGYDECEDKCLAVYHNTCGGKDTVGAAPTDSTTRMRRRRPSQRTNAND